MSIESLYNKWHDQIKPNASANSIWHKKFFQQDILKTLQGKTILEIACGRGEFANELSKSTDLNFTYTGCDISDSAILQAQRNVVDHRMTFVKMDVNNINFDTDHFDVVISFETIEHSPTLSTAVKELCRVLKPNGTLYISTPNYLNSWGLYRIYRRIIGKRWTEAGQPINKFVIIPHTLVLLRRAGIELDEWGSSIFSYPSLQRKVKHLQISENKFTRWFGLQSYFRGRKR